MTTVSITCSWERLQPLPCWRGEGMTAELNPHSCISHLKDPVIPLLTLCDCEGVAMCHQDVYSVRVDTKRRVCVTRGSLLERVYST